MENTGWDIKRIKEELRKLDKRFNTKSANLIIEIDARLKSVLAYYETDRNSKPLKFKFSENLIYGYDDECIKAVIAHEYAHYYVEKDDPKVCHNHDKVWDDFRKSINGSPQYFDCDILEGDNLLRFKYVQVCRNCNKVVDLYKGKPKVNYACGECTCSLKTIETKKYLAEVNKNGKN